MLTDADCRTLPAHRKTDADGKEGRLALGSYPDVTLKAVRKGMQGRLHVVALGV